MTKKECSHEAMVFVKLNTMSGHTSFCIIKELCFWKVWYDFDLFMSKRTYFL